MFFAFHFDSSMHAGCDSDADRCDAGGDQLLSVLFSWHLLGLRDLSQRFRTYSIHGDDDERGHRGALRYDQV